MTEEEKNKYTGHIQKALCNLWVALNIQSTKFTIMVDETTDVSTNEVVIVLRWVDLNLEVYT